MVDSTGINSSGTKPEEKSDNSEGIQNETERSNILGTRETEGADSGKPEESPASEKSPGRSRTKSNQRWMKLRTTVQLSGAMSSTNHKSKPSLKREDSFLKRFSTRQIPETQETVDTGDETETLSGSQTQNEVNRRRRKRRKEMSKTVVNPDENFYFYWLMTVTVCVLYNLWTLIVRQSFPELQEAANAFWYSGDGFTDVVFVCDIMVQFRTGYLEQGLMVYNSKKLATHYLKSRAFILDILSLLPLDFLQLNIGVNPMLRFPRFLKIYRVYNYYYMVESRTVYPNLWRVVNLIHILLILAHWFGCFYYLLSEAEGFQGDWVYPYRHGDYATLTRKYLGSLYWSTLTLTTIGDLPTPETNAESRGRSKAMTSSGRSEGSPRRGHKSRLLQFNSNYGYLFTIISYLIGVFIFATIVGQVGNVITNRNANRLEFERLLDGAKTYMRHHKVPGGMKRRVLRWYDYSWSRGRIQGGGDINTALGLLPDKLKTELALHVNLSVLKKVTIFQECQPEFLHDLVLKMKAYIFTPGDLICRKGEVAREMFIIADGILDVISDTGRVLTTMKAGDFFGEIGILNLDGLNKRTADVRSVGYSELFSLSREDVLAAMKDYPEAQEILKSLGRKRLMEAKNASKTHKAQAKQVKEHDSSGESDTAGKRIVEKLRSDVKGLKNALGRSRRGTRMKETEKAVENPGGKTPSKKQSLLRRMSHVQSSDEYEANDAEQSPIGAGLPLLQRLKLLKEKQEKEREERDGNKLVIRGGNEVKKDENFEEETVTTGLPFSEKLKLIKQREIKDSTNLGSLVISSTVRTQVTGVRFDKSITKPKTISSPRKKVTVMKEKKEDAENVGTLLKERFRVVPASEEQILPSKSLPETEIIPRSSSNFESECETSFKVCTTKETDNSVPKLLRNKPEVPKSKDAWKLLKNSSISLTKPNKKLKNEGSNTSKKVSKKNIYLSKSDTVLEKQNTWEKDDGKRSRSISPPENSISLEKNSPKSASGTTEGRKQSRFVSRTPKTEDHADNNDCWEIDGNKPKMKKYNSISDLSPEYSGLPFVKKLKILNERQKLEELEKELLVRSASLDGPERTAAQRQKVLVRSRSEASAIEGQGQGQAGQAEAPRTEPPFRLTKATKNTGNNDRSRIYSEGSTASPESNETLERRHLKSILKKLSAEETTSDEDQTWRNCEGRKRTDYAELKRLMRAPTVEGYAARHKKLTKSVTFDSDAASAPAQPEECQGKKFSPTSPTAILTLQLSNLSMIPIAKPVTDKMEETGKINEKTNEDKDILMLKMTEQSQEEGQNGFRISDGENAEEKNIFMPYILQDLIEKHFRMLPFIKSMDDDILSEIKGGISQIFQQLLEEIQKKFQTQFSNLQSEVEKRDEIILQLHSKIHDLEVNNLEQVENKTKILEECAENRESASEVYFRRNDAFETIEGICLPSVESSTDCSPKSENSNVKGYELMILSEKGNFSTDTGAEVPSDYLNDLVNYEEEDSLRRKDEIHLLPYPTETTRCLFRRDFGRSLESPSVQEIELAEYQGSFRKDPKRKRHRMEFHLIRNFSVDNSELETTRKFDKLGDEMGKYKDEKKYVESRSKASFINRVAQLQRTFSCSQEKSADFVALDIDDSSGSSDSENVHNKDWEIQMLVEELGKRHPDWETEEDKWDSEVESLNDVRKLQEEVDTLKRMICEGDLTRLTSSELDMLETIIESKDQKISQLAKSNSLDSSDRSKRINCTSASNNKIKKCEKRKKPSLRQKIGHALSFDFHEIENRKPKPREDDIKHNALPLRKQKTVSYSPREDPSLVNLWHTSSRLRHQVLQDSNRIKTNGHMAANPSCGLPALGQGLLSSGPRHLRTSLPALPALLPASQEFRRSLRRLASSLGSFEDARLDNDVKQSSGSVFEVSEASREAIQKESQNFLSPSTSGLVSSNDCTPSNSLNNFIKTVGQRVKQVMIGDLNMVRNQVPTISKLCDEQLISKISSEDLGEVSTVPSEPSDATPTTDDPSNTSDYLDHEPKIEPPDL